MVHIPAAGTPNASYHRNPTLLPNFDKPVATGSGTLGLQSPAAFLAANPRANATVTATIGGTITAGDILTLELTNNVFSNIVLQNTALTPIISHSYTVVAGDSVATIAQAFAKAFNDDAVAQGFGVEVDAGGSSGAVLTFNHPGPVGNFSTLTAPTLESAKITIGGTALTGDVVSTLFSGSYLGTVAPALGTATLSGTVAAGDTVPLTFTSSFVTGSPITVTYTVVAGDTLNSIAQNLANLSDAALPQGATVYAEDGVIFFSWAGAIGNSVTVSSTPTHGGGGSEAVTFSNSGVLAGGTGVAGGQVAVTQAVTTGQSSSTIGGNLATAINANPVLIAASITASNSSGVVTLTVPATDEPITVTSWVNTGTPTATITGTVAAGDVLTLTITNTAVTGSPVTVSYTAPTGATTTTLATGLAAAINSNTALASAGISATSATNVVTFVYSGLIGQIRISQSVTTGSETITLTATPTTTAVLSTAATETITIANSGKLSGGSGPVFASNNFNYSNNGQTQSFFYGQPYVLGYDVITNMVNQGLPIV